MIVKKSLLFLGPIIILAAFGVISLNKFNYLPATPILELVFFSSFFLIDKKFNRELLIYWCLIFCYLTYFYFISVHFNHVYILDFLISIKVFIYLLVIILFAKKRIINLSQLAKFYNIILFVYFIKYSYSIAIHSYGTRPGVFTENNFELLLPIILSIGIWEIRRKIYKREIFLLAIIVLFSASRSGAVELVCTLSFSLFLSKNKTKLIKFLYLIVGGLLIIAIVYTIFLYRTNSISEIDRYKFLLCFFNETKEWGIFNWIFGSTPLTPMSEYTCRTLSYYIDLFSKAGDGKCYSVILHSMIMRVIFDHGILGLIVIFFVLYRLLIIAGLSKRASFFILIIFIINGLSVSSLNSVYAVFPLLILILTYKSLQEIKTLNKKIDGVQNAI
jgi:hypothetical protein